VKKIEQVYFKLQRHLDKQPVGFPATQSRVELKILKHIFTPEEAQIAIYLSYKFDPLETVFDRVRHIVGSSEELKELLDGSQKKGGVESKIKGGKRHYCLAPLVIGMYEMQLKRLTPEFIKYYNEYINDKKFGIDFLSAEPPQTRTIPIAKSIHPQYNVSTFDEVAALLEQAEAPFAILECICRKKKAMEGGSCKVTDRKETCLAIGHIAQHALLGDFGREITRDEAMSILEKNQKQGLVLQLSNTEKAEFICSCCGCCCGLLEVHKHLPKPVDFWVSNLHAVVDRSACDGCGVCEKRCQVGAVHVRKKKQPAVVNLDRCIGCGLCVPTCPRNAMTLLKKSIEVRPPETREELYDIIMSNKKGRLGKLKLTGKLFVDAVKTGQTHLLK
jgi:electron transport complex protein RnfB